MPDVVQPCLRLVTGGPGGLSAYRKALPDRGVGREFAVHVDRSSQAANRVGDERQCMNLLCQGGAV